MEGKKERNLKNLQENKRLSRKKVPQNHSGYYAQVFKLFNEKNRLALYRSELKMPRQAYCYFFNVSYQCYVYHVYKSDGIDSIVARVSLVNHYGHVIYDTYVSPSEEVSDYRTSVSGIRSHHLKDAPSFDEVRKKVSFAFYWNPF